MDFIFAFLLLAVIVVGIYCVIAYLEYRRQIRIIKNDQQKNSLSYRKMKFGYGIYRKKIYNYSAPDYFFITWVPMEYMLLPKITKILSVIHHQSQMHDIAEIVNNGSNS